MPAHRFTSSCTRPSTAYDAAHDSPFFVRTLLWNTGWRNARLPLRNGVKRENDGIPVSSWYWRHKELDDVSNHRLLDCLLNYLFRRKANIKVPCHWPLWEDSPVTGEFPAQRARNAENSSIWWRYRGLSFQYKTITNWTPSYTLLSDVSEHAESSAHIPTQRVFKFWLMWHKLCG